MSFVVVWDLWLSDDGARRVGDQLNDAGASPLNSCCSVVHQRLGTSGATVGLSGFGIYSCKSLPQYNGECEMPFPRGRDRRGGVLSTGRDRNSGNKKEGSMRPLEPGACGWQFDVVQPVGEASGQSINLIQQD